MHNSYNYVFHYNPSNQIWSAIPRDKYHQYWNEPKVEGVLKSTDFKVLVEIIHKGEEFIKSIK